MNWRSRWRTIGERSLVASGIPRISRAGLRDDVLVLAYHNIVPAGCAPTGDRSLHLPQEAFAAQLDWLLQRYEVLPLADALSGRSRPVRRPRVAITFDDAYRGAVTAGVGELVTRGLPATIFVAPAFLGGATFWWDALAAPGAMGLDEEVRRHALCECRGESAMVLRWARETGRLEQPTADHATCASEEELCAAASQRGISLGSHTWSHPNLARLNERELAEELSRPLVWLEERFGSCRRYLSYPYGATTTAVARGAAAAGYLGAFRIEGGWLRGAAHDPFALPRLNVPAGLSIDGFVLRTAGLLCR